MNSKPSSFRKCGALLFVLVTMLAGCGRVTIEHEESFQAIDALYTAVTSRRPELVDTCEKRLKELEADKKLPASTCRDLHRVIQQSRNQQWQPAAEKLDALMRNMAH